MVNKALGQHWLRNREILEEIAELAAFDVGEGVTCVEIGPGLGTLTSSLLKRFPKVLAVEYDADLARKLPGSFPGKNLEVINGDILQFDFSEVKAPYVVAGNIPYYITSPILEHVLAAETLAERVVLLMQKEVAERVVSERESLLSLRCKNRAEVYLGPVVLAQEFTPPPKVDSQVLVLEPHAPVVSEEVFSVISRGFSAPRKKLALNLAGWRSKEEIREMLRECGLDADARPSDLHLEDWQKIYQKMV